MGVFVILPAAGIGTRMSVGHTGSNATSAVAPKQFLTIGGVPILIHSLRAFLAVNRVKAIFVAVRATELDRVRSQVADFGLGERVHVVEGGDSRQQTVAKALAALPAQSDDVILVHDA